MEEHVSYHINHPEGLIGNETNELELRFNSNPKTSTPLTKTIFDNVIQKLKSSDFVSYNEVGDVQLKIQNEFTDVKTGRTRLSNLRTEINGMDAVQKYCKSDEIDTKIPPTFLMKSQVKKDDGEILRPGDIEKFNLRVSLQKETNLKPNSPMVRSLLNNWKSSKKSFRLIRRVTFVHSMLPVNVDMSVVKMGRKGLSYNFQDAGVAEAVERYEIEVEVKNYLVGPDTPFDTAAKLQQVLKKVVMIILSGIQNTNYPVSIPEQHTALADYGRLVFGKEMRLNELKEPKYFCGPSSYTLELKNVQPLRPGDESVSEVPNIRENFSVTDKADGIRKLLYVAVNGKAYIITMNMEVEFTGVKITDEGLWNTLLDGEHIVHGKDGGFLNRYAAFDVYFMNGRNVRGLPFVPPEKSRSSSSKETEARIVILEKLMKGLNGSASSVTGKDALPLTLTKKKFYLGAGENGVFGACRDILQQVADGLFPYHTDGLIFTPIHLGVGADEVGKEGPLTKSTWKYSFKWKPAEENTIDFLVTSQKDKSGAPKVSNIFKNGMDTGAENQVLQYKSYVLRCGFDERRHGFLNPCQMVLEGEVPETRSSDDSKNYKPVPFYPTNPYDETAHKCNIVLRNDKAMQPQAMCENNDIIENNTIVEFRWDETRDAEFRWVPLRVRYDKTAELRAGFPNYGNAYHVANSNWSTIHHPITPVMITTGVGIPEPTDDDVYYQRQGVQSSTRALRDFHNLVVKYSLITKVSKQGDNFIDYAVGKAGDLSKWVHSKLRFVLGIDVSRDNIENKLDGACARFLKKKMDGRRIPDMLFVQGNSALNIRDGAALYSEKGKQIVKSVFGEIPKNPALGKAVTSQYGKVAQGFNTGGVMFAMHYFFQNEQTLSGFLRNIAETIEVGGHFVGVCFDGHRVFDMLRDKERGQGITLTHQGKKIWEVVKEYDQTDFEPNATSLGMSINVYQETINKYFSEYLVNFEYFTRLMDNYGFRPLTRDEANDIGMPDGIGSLEDLFRDLERNRDRDSKKYIGQSLYLSENEKIISFLNNYFIFKKVRNVDAERISLVEADETEAQQKLDEDDTAEARLVAEATLKSMRPTSPK